MEKLTEQEVIRRQKMEDLRAMGIEPFGHAYQRTHKSGEIRAAYEDCTKEELEERSDSENCGTYHDEETSGKGRLHAYSGYRRTDSDLCS